MKDKLNDNDIDKIFRDSIESAEAQPSENFWSKAYEGIIARENSIYQKRIAAWRGTAIVLGLIAMVLVGYNVYITGKVDNLGQQVADIQKFQSSNSSIAQSQNGSNTLAVNNNETLNQSHGVTANNQPIVASVNHTNAINANTPASNRHVSHNLSQSSENHQNGSVANVNAVVVNHVSNAQIQSSENQQNNLVTNASNNTNTVNTGTVQQVTQHNVESALVSSNEQAQQHKQVGVLDNSSNIGVKNNSETVVEQNATTKTSPATASTDVIYPDVNSSPDSTNSFSGQIASQSKSHFMEKVMPKISISAYISPSVASPVMNGYSIADDLSAVQLNSREHQQLGISYGANIGFDISSKVTIEAGFGYRSNQFSIAPTVLYPHTGDPTQAYHLVTSSGTITMPYLLNEGSGESVTAAGNGVRSYMSIPVQLKYNLLTVRHKFTVYATGGAALNILSTDKATINYGNAGGAGVAPVNNISGANSFTCSYLLGVGARYKLGKGFDVYAEPYYMGSVMPINSAAYIRAFSNFWSFTTGLSYHF